MSYQALYRVWRPRTFQDIVGQSHITQTIQNAIRQEKFSHAYVFSGPRGTGKTSAAKILAKTINCEQAPVSEPCNECAACLGIQDGTISDVIEIDAASNTSVDDVRDIRDNVKYAASSVPYKVYIIDEVHMISTSAFNALLKTLEEPPKHVVFILATTEPHKIPLTIMSRCQCFDFKPITKQAIVGRMQTIVESEGISISLEALEAVALAAEGGMRDALSILDQAVSYSEEDVTLDDVLAVTGGVSQQILTEMIQTIHEKNPQHALSLLDGLIKNGKDPGRFVFDLLYFLRDLLLYKSAPELEGILERAILDTDFKQLSQTVPEEWIRDAINQLNRCQQDMKWTNNPKMFIEIAILTLTNQQNNERDGTGEVDHAAITKLTEKIDRLEKEIGDINQNKPTQAQVQSEPKRKQVRPPKNGYKIPYERIRTVLGEAKRDALHDVHKQWAAFLGALKEASAPAHATIQDSKPAAASDEALIVAFKYDIHCSLFLDNRETVESILQRTLQKNLTIIPIPANNWQELREEYIQGKEQTSAATEPEAEDPLVEEARKLVGDDLLHIHD